ncbi:MAG TPA: CHAT domain-containing protein [Thermoanaerobaculia bacterium]
MTTRRSGARIVWSCSIVTAFAVLGILLHEPLRAMWRKEIVRRATEPAGLTPRLSSGTRPETVLAASVSRLPLRRSLAEAAMVLLEDSGDDVGPPGLHRAGVGWLLMGDARAAADHLRQAAAREQHAAWWSDLAAAEILAGDETGDPERHLAALAAADQAISLDERFPQAHFNKAIAVERLGFERLSVVHWRKALELEGGSSSGSAIAVHIAGLATKKTARERWGDAEHRIAAGKMPANLEQLIAEHPQEARLWAEEFFLGRWGKGEDELFLAVAQIIGDRIAARSGERLLQQAVAEIESARASGDAHRLALLAEGAVAYMNGRAAYRANKFAMTALEFEKARGAFAAARGQMLGVVELWLAILKMKQNRNAEARVALVVLRDCARAAHGHEALIAEAERHVALIDGLDGRWGDALEVATSSRDRFARLRERQREAEAELTMAGALRFFGQPRAAWKHFVHVAAAFSASGDWDRLQVTATAMTYAELRRGHWSIARSLARIEIALADKPVRLAHGHLRAAVAALGAGDLAPARSSWSEARAAAASVKDDVLLADIITVEGRLLASSDPGAAVSRFTEAIGFQRSAGRGFTLPELHLVRGRAELAQGASDAALADFEQGIGILEKGRHRVSDIALRAGLFDDVRDLFGDAVAVSIERGDERAAFAYLERGRARTLLDELGDVQLPERPTLAAVQRNLDHGMLMLSYALLGDRLAIFAIDRDTIIVRFSGSSAGAVTQHTKALVRALESGSDISALAGGLYDALFEPVRDRLSDATTLVLVADTALAQLPFAVLFDRRANRYLVETHDSLIVPSAAVFMACRSRAADIPQLKSIAIFANPKVPPDLSLPVLPAAAAEAPRIAQLYAQPLVLRAVEATAARFRSEAARYGIVQFSGHTQLDDAEPWKSALLFDQRLSARDIASMRFHRTRLAVLGACSTLTPNTEYVEGTSPIAASFLIAGVPAVVGSLWDIDDAEAAAVMVRLHEPLARGVPAATALREVQRGMLAAHPRQWASFTVLGADR